MNEFYAAGHCEVNWLFSDFKDGHKEGLHSPKTSFSRNLGPWLHPSDPQLITDSAQTRNGPASSLPINRSSRLRIHHPLQSPAPVSAPRLPRAVGSGGNLPFTGPPTMTITYSCIANGRVILADLAWTGGSYQVLLPSPPPSRVLV